jgi:hypothetical protein
MHPTDTGWWWCENISRYYIVDTVVLCGSEVKGQQEITVTILVHGKGFAADTGDCCGTR